MTNMMMTIAGFAAVLSTSACATIDRGTPQAFEIQTTPSGAQVETSLGKGCAPTPCVIPNVSREATFAVTIKKQGYKTRSYKVTHERGAGIAANLAGNIFTNAGVGAVLDANNGATQELVPNPLVVALEPEYAHARIIQKPIERIADEVLDGSR